MLHTAPVSKGENFSFFFLAFQISFTLLTGMWLSMLSQLLKNASSAREVLRQVRYIPYIIAIWTPRHLIEVIYALISLTVMVPI
ncbi:hypothetical protein V8F06_002153 [Rhypophila decipiens]